ncbi:hypothetical protein GCM10023093_17970 [Nemorincola caseinilytica]|uniref:Potassium transporter KefB n=1 Tax=Nemorincola caseinilytica TaxID=2054315 RepID=A0ABP8NHH0_9BACT
MTQIHLSSQGSGWNTLGKRMLLGGAIGLAVISFFVLGADRPVPPEWGELWMVRPLIVTPLAGVSAGAMYHFTDRMFPRRGWQRIVARTFSVLAYIVAIWLGTVLGLAGTMWN